MSKLTTDTSWEVEVSENTSGQQLMNLVDGSAMWKYLCDRYEGATNETTKAMTKRQLYAQLESARCKQTGIVEGHLNYMCRLKGRLSTVGMALDDAMFSGILESSLPSNERFDRLRGYVDVGMDCVNTPDKDVAMDITFDKANQAETQLNRLFGGGKLVRVSLNKGGGGGGHGKGGSEQGCSKGQGKSRACFACGSTNHLVAKFPEKVNKQ
ncbi:Hypothetical protein PHPALM_8620 [Phytophthora palmivora]|uniref:Uncharacterized protein n=1 Tax=Phytophthora palmivora TaxID=4796 RepID=A0A2P4Y9C6_9STRA|nr:Hypothetical protein PHPALM_8620 [Phytophthora palmivora]